MVCVAESQLEVLLRMGQRIVCDQRRDVRQLGGLGAEKFAPGRSVEEQVRDGQRGSSGQGRVVDVKDLAARDLHSGSCGFVSGCRLQSHARNRSNRGQRLAAKSQGRDGEQIVGCAQFRGGVPLKRQQRIVAVHSLPVVADADQPPPAGLDLDANAIGARVQCVLQQLLDHRGRPVHHLAGSDLVGNLVGKNADAAHKTLG